MDGTIRDLAALRGTYRIIPETKGAVQLLLKTLQEMDVQAAHILLDEPVSNSGRLKALIAEIGEAYPLGLDIQIQRDVDRMLWEQENVITTDSVILDHCVSWLNINAKCMTRLGKTALNVWK